MTIVLDIQAGPGVASAQQTGAREVDEPEVAARAWALAGLRSGEYLAGEGASRELPTASTTKIIAVLVVLKKADLDEEVAVSEDAAYTRPAYSNVGPLPGDTLSVRELLMATLISSSDDAAYAPWSNKSAAKLA
jgi:D-alanyl-D-alanine carboxypeptidase (penicillin-binding protein 5/6)